MGQLHEAAKKNDMNTIIKLAGTNGEEYIRKKDLNHNNILHIACFHGHQSLFSYAMSKTDINAENLGGDTPLIIAAKQSNMDFAKRLITAGADGISINTVNKPNNHGNTPLHYACFWRCAEIVNLLIASHCNIGVKNNYGQVTYFNTSFKIEEQIKAVLLANPAPFLAKDGKLPTDASQPPSAKPLKKPRQELTYISHPSDIKVLEIIEESNYYLFFKAMHQGIALRVIQPNLHNDVTEEQKTVLKEELSLIKNISSKNLIPINSVCVVTGNLCYTIDDYHCQSLDSIVFDPNIQFLEREVIGFGVDICKGLLALHENELTHGNLKTKHAFLYKDGTVKLGFYGFQKSIFNNLQRLPLTYFEPAYLSPEIVGGADITDSRKCDVYAFGIVFLELVTRMPAWPDDTPMIVGLQIYNNETPPIPKYVPKELQTIMQEAWMPVAERSSISAILDKLSKLNF